MRLNECEQVQKDLSEALGINLTVVDAAQEFLDGLKGIEDPEVRLPQRCNLRRKALTVLQKKRKFIGMAPAFHRYAPAEIPSIRN
jgi:GMP synthase PP-ATPase subunit